MHTLLVVAAKLLGIHFLFRGLIHLINGVLFLGAGPGNATLLPFLHAALALGFASILSAQPPWLARRLGVSSGESIIMGEFEPAAVLRTGIASAFEMHPNGG